jgi:hypothetical protein
MVRNLIVTCGTSQIQLNKFPESSLKTKLDRFTATKLNSPDIVLPDESYLEDGEIVAFVEEVADFISLQWEKRSSLIGARGNIFGAEISTLVAMELQAGSYQWDPATDEIILIASQSKSGLFSAGIISKIVEKGWKISPSRIRIKMVPGLNYDATDPDVAMYQFAVIIGESLRESHPKEEIKNIFVGSGGFKSSLPLLTIYSFLFGIKLVYTFEYSSKLQSLNPRVDMEEESARLFWQSTWQKLKRQKWMGDENTSAYLQYILDYRINVSGNY